MVLLQNIRYLFVPIIFIIIAIIVIVIVIIIIAIIMLVARIHWSKLGREAKGDLKPNLDRSKLFVIIIVILTMNMIVQVIIIILTKITIVQVIIIIKLCYF